MLNSIQLVTLFTKDQIHKRILTIVGQIAEDVGYDELVVIGILKGSFVFLADFIRKLFEYEISVLIDFVGVSSYGSGTITSGNVQLLHDTTLDIKNRRVLLLDDILDSGFTMNFLLSHFKQKEPSSLHVCVLLDKTGRRKCPIEADYVGFQINDEYVVGYGLDYDNRFREMPHISILSKFPV